MSFLIDFACGAFSNWFLRGGGIESWLLTPNKDKKAVKWLIAINAANLRQDGQVSFSLGKPLNCLFYALLAYRHDHDALLSLSLFAGMYIGQSFGWGEYIGAMLGKKIFGSVRWGIAQMTIRGLKWAACLVAAAAIVQVWADYKAVLPFAVSNIAVGALMGLIYYSFILLKQKGMRQTVVLNHWTGSEMLYGGLVWACLHWV